MNDDHIAAIMGSYLDAEKRGLKAQITLDGLQQFHDLLVKGWEEIINNATVYKNRFLSFIQSQSRVNISAIASGEYHDDQGNQKPFKQLLTMSSSLPTVSGFNDYDLT